MELCQGGLGTGSAPEGRGHGTGCQSWRCVWTTPSDIGFDFFLGGWSCAEPGVGFSDSYGFTPTQDIL